MKKLLIRKIEPFISWLHENSDRLLSMSTDSITDMLIEKLCDIDEHLGVEVSEIDEENNREIIFTAFSDPDRFGLIYQIVNSLGNINGLKFTALKQPRGFAFKLTLGEYLLNAKKLSFSPIPDIPFGIQLIVSNKIMKTLPLGQESEEIAWLIVETGVGEELASQLEHIEFIDSNNPKTKSPITKLKAYIEKLKEIRGDRQV